MALFAEQITVTTSPTLLCGPDSDGCRVYLRTAGQGDVFIGPSDVTEDTGLGLTNDIVVDIQLGPGECIYGIVGEDTAKVYVLTTLSNGV